MENNNKKFPFLKKYSRKVREVEIETEDEMREVIVEKNNGFNTFEVIVIIFISVLFGIVVGCMIMSSKNSFGGLEVSPEVQEFVATYQSILDNYYDSINEKELMNAAISGMVNSLDDPYSNYMDSETTDSFNQTIDGSYVGIGVTVSLTNNQCVIIDIFEDSPADKAGLKVGDVIIKVGKRKISEENLDQVSEFIQGKSGTKVSITVLRNNEEKTVKVSRGVIEIPAVASKVIEKEDQKVGYIVIDSFTATVYKQFKKELTSLEKKGIDSLIIDVRSNPGGYLSQTRKILDLFFKKGTTLYQIETKGEKEKVKATSSTYKKYPVAILINQDSASASEILASSFQDNYKKSTIIGVTSYGKGTIQKAVELSSGASFKYTTQKWLTAKGKWINEKGVVPDIVVEQGVEYQENPTDENDLLLQKALEEVTKKEAN